MIARCDLRAPSKQLLVQVIRDTSTLQEKCQGSAHPAKDPAGPSTVSTCIGNSIEKDLSTSDDSMHSHRRQPQKARPRTESKDRSYQHPATESRQHLEASFRSSERLGATSYATERPQASLHSCKYRPHFVDLAARVPSDSSDSEAVETGTLRQQLGTDHMAAGRVFGLDRGAGKEACEKGIVI